MRFRNVSSNLVFLVCLMLLCCPQAFARDDARASGGTVVLPVCEKFTHKIEKSDTKSSWAEDDGDDTPQEILDWAEDSASGSATAAACEAASTAASEYSHTCPDGSPADVSYDAPDCENVEASEGDPQCESELSESGQDNPTEEDEENYKSLLSAHAKRIGGTIDEENLEIAWSQELVTAIAECTSTYSITLTVRCCSGGTRLLQQESGANPADF